MKIEESFISDVKIIHQFRADDNRGSFIKTFHHSSLLENGIDFEIKESFYSISSQDVIRGMHFHHPPFDHDKIVFCVDGSILDIALDLRKNSPTYGQAVSTELSFDNHKALYIPKGFAHGFLVISEEATFNYKCTDFYAPEYDCGVLWNDDEIGIEWPLEGIDNILLSEKDKNQKRLNELDIPFKY